MSNFSSDCDSSFATESEADNEYFWNEESMKNNVCLPNYTTEVENIIRENVDVTTANAIELNHHYRAKLRLLRTQLETLLGQCQARLKDVDGMVDNLRHNRKDGIPYRVRTPGYICGQPFFKDHELYPGPHNADYLYRKNVKKEFFPLDMFEVAETHWTPKDKLGMKNGIWLQALEFLRREGALRLKMCSNPVKAERIRQDIASYKTLALEAIWSRVQAYEAEYGGERFKVDWLVISNVNVLGRHTAAACEAMWNQYLRPELKKGSWHAEEDSLLAAVRIHNCQDWSSIAQSVGNRSEYQCFVHFRSYFSQQAQIERKPWTPEEDARLLRVVQENRMGSNVVWNKVVENMPLRNKIQVYHRYKYTLMRPMKGAKFTAEEDCIITAYVQQYGDDFKFFPEHLLPGRTMKQVWARYNNTLRFVDKRAGWSLEEDKRLMSYIAEHLTEEGPEKISWSDCSRHLSNHSRASCRSRYYTIEKFLEKHPNATLEDVPRRERKKLSTDVTHENWIKTIIDIRSTPNEDRDRSPTEDKLCQSFNTVGELGLYEQMKFCFRYQFGHKLSLEVDRRHVHTGTKILMHLLEGFHESDLVSNTYFLAKVDRSMMIAAMQAPLDWTSVTGALRPKKTPDGDAMLFCRLPPSYNTVLGLRGVCLHAYYGSKMLPQSAKVGKKAKGVKRPRYDQALALFVNRFKKIFHWSMLLTMLNIDDVKFETEQKHREEAKPTVGYENELPSSSGRHLSVVGAESHIAAESEKIVGHDQLVPIPIGKLMQTSDYTTATPQTSSLVSFSLNGICVGLPGGTEGDIEIVKSITIIDPKDLPASTEPSLHWEGNIARTEEVSDFQSSPAPHVIHKSTRRQRIRMTSDGKGNDYVHSLNSRVEGNESLHCQAGSEIQTNNSKTRETCVHEGVQRSSKNTIADNHHVSHEETYSENEQHKSQQQNFSKSDMVPQILFVHSALTAASYQEEPAQSFNVQAEVQSNNFHQAMVESNIIMNYKCDNSQYEDRASNSVEFNPALQTQNHVRIDEVGWKHSDFNDSYNASLENYPVGTSVVYLSQVGHTAESSSPGRLPPTEEVSEDIVSVSSDEDNRTSPPGENNDHCQTSFVRDVAPQGSRIEGPILENHCKEVFIVREVGSETQQCPLEEFILPHRSGDEHGNECLIVEVEDHQEDANENPIEEVFIISEANDHNSQPSLADIERKAKMEFQAMATGNTMLSEETMGQPVATTEVSTEKCNTSSAGHFNELLSTIDESYTAVDIIRILNEGRNAGDSETTGESDSEEE
uniref:snRNA-activating protein complex subunit 4 n=1 Tax=Anopheles atroparvus TaxID=41427 RepID=A0AAG5D069_ANOAO